MRFKYLGEAVKPTALKRSGTGPTLAFIFHQKDGKKVTLNAPNQTTGFVIGQDIGVEITDKRVIRHMKADPRFAQL